MWLRKCAFRDLRHVKKYLLGIEHICRHTPEAEIGIIDVH